MLVVTGSRDRTFKLWDRVEAAPIVSLAHDQHTRKQTVSQRQLEVAESAVATAGQKRARSTGSDSKDAVDPSMPSPQRYIWQCRSVGFYRDYPCSAAAFSGDGTALALGYGRHVTLWDWRDNALKGVLVPPVRGSYLTLSHSFALQTDVLFHCAAPAWSRVDRRRLEWRGSAHVTPRGAAAWTLSLDP